MTFSKRKLQPLGYTADEYPIEGPFWSWMIRISPYIEYDAMFQAADNG